MKEIWEDIVGYEGYYEVSNMGRIRSKDRKVINKLTNGHSIRKGILLKQRKLHGYNYVNLCVNDKRKHVRVHRIVAETFLCNRKNKPTVNHINGVKTDNRLVNLEWATHKEQQMHASKLGMLIAPNKKKIRCITKNKIFESSYKAAEWLNDLKFNNARLIKRLAVTLRRCANKERKTAYGLRWEFID